ncbi:MAG: glycosyltransferase [Chlorobi bacterium]|nr:glycosyltransferase [Chlorobiota bacterium]
MSYVNPIIIPVFLVLLLTGISYLFLIGKYISGWDKVDPFDTGNSEENEPVSVIIPFRNEASNLPKLIAALSAQQYPPGFIEFLLVNDHSTDASESIILNATGEDPRFRLIHNDGSGKKDALLTGIRLSSGKLILQTDADTIPGNQWIRIMVSFSGETKAGMIAGPVIMHPGTRFLDHLQALEHLSLTAVGIGAFGTGNPVFCSGANMAYRKSLITGLSDPFLKSVTSGDDVFLLHHLKTLKPEAIKFIKNKAVAVLIFPTNNLRSFFRQRGRWAGKSVYFRDLSTYTQAIRIFLMNVAIAGLTLLSFFNIFWLAITLIMYLMKSWPDLILLKRVAIFFNRKDLLKYFIPAQIIYPWYVLISVFTGIAGLLNTQSKSEEKNQWK